MRLTKSKINALLTMIGLYVERGSSVEAGRRALERYGDAEAAEAALRGEANTREVSR